MKGFIFIGVIVGLAWFMVFNATFNNISVISWWSVLLEETGVPGENHLLSITTNVVNSNPIHGEMYSTHNIM
jgi:hypothetical protein